MAFPTSVTIASSTGLRLRCLAGRIHGLGPRALLEMMCALTVSSAAMPIFESFGGIAHHAALIEAYGGRNLSPTITLIKK